MLGLWWMGVCVCLRVITPCKSQQTLWNSSPASFGNDFVSAVWGVLTAQPRHRNYHQPRHPTAWPLFFILGFVTASPVMVCNSRLLLGVSTFLCLYSVCLCLCVCVCRISTISPRWLKYWQTVFNWGRLNGSHLNGAQTEAPRWRVTLWLLTCKAHCAHTLHFVCLPEKLYCIRLLQEYFRRCERLKSANLGGFMWRISGRVVFQLCAFFS